jgi:peroxiredoxin
MKDSLTFLLIILNSIMALGQGKEYKLIGKVEGLQNNAKVYLFKGNEGIDSVESKNGEFVFKGSLQEPTAAVLVLNSLKNSSNLFSRKKLLLDNAIIYINGPVNNIRGAKLKTSSPYTNDYEAFALNSRPLDPLRLKHEKQRIKSRELQKSFYELPVESRPQSLADEMSKAVKVSITTSLLIDSLETGMLISYLAKHPTSKRGLQELYKRRDRVSFPQLRKLYHNSGSVNNDYKYSKLLQSYIENFKGLMAGSSAPDFLIHDMDGKPVSLKDYKGKYVLLEFWGSWCSPCRWENPKLNELYDQYKGKGFEIIGIGMDDKEALKKAIITDRITWRNLLVPEIFDSKIAMQYGVVAAPSNFLINPEGNIIAKDLKEFMVQEGHQSLSEKLSEIFDNERN